MIESNYFEEVMQIKMGRDIEGQVFYWVAAYLVDGLLIDTGCRYTAEELGEFLEGKNLKLAVNTHYHEDHIGANNMLKERFGIPVFASAGSAPLINQVPKLYPYQQMVWGYPEPGEVDCLPRRIETEHFHFDVIDTPGHGEGHIALVESEKGWCFCGDLFVSPNPMVVRPEEDITEIVRSMKKLIDLGTDRLVLITSVGSILQDGRGALQACMDYLRDLSRKAKELDARGLVASAIRERLFGEESYLAGPTDGQFSSENLIRAVLGADI